MKKPGMTVASLAFVVVALIVVASAAAVEIYPKSTPSATTTPTSTVSTTTSEATGSLNGLRLTLSVDPSEVYSGGSVNVSLSDFNTLASTSSPPIVGPPTVGKTTLMLGPCNQLPLGIGIYQGNYGSGNISQATPLDLAQPGLVYACPVEFNVAYFSFTGLSDEITLYSPQPSGQGNTTVPTQMWTRPDAFAENFSGYWTVQNQTCDFSCVGVFHQFLPGVYTVVGGDDWGQLMIVHFSVRPGQTTSTSESSERSSSSWSTTTSAARGSASAASTQGLQLRASLNSTQLQPGDALQIVVSEFNTLTSSNNVSVSTQWAVRGALGPCQNEYVQPFGVAVYSGHVDALNLSTAAQLDVFPIVPCPMFIRLVTGYDFQAQSDLAVVLPGSGAVPSPLAASVNISEVYSGHVQGQPLPPGSYTVVAADEWGAVVFMYFTVL